MNLLIFGFGFAGRALARQRPGGWMIAGASRDPTTRAGMANQGVTAVDPADAFALSAAVAHADGVLVAAPPTPAGCPAIAALAPHLAEARPGWIGYLSTTGVYGDRGGGWVFEESPLAPLSPEGRRRVDAEAAWRTLAAQRATPLTVFRLPGIYGPGRSPLDRLRAGEARRIVKPGQVFSRIHVDDLAGGVFAAMGRPKLAGVFNLCDDEPAPPADVAAYAAHLLGVAPPPEEPFDAATLSLAAQRFWAESKRVSNAKAKAALGWLPTYPSYREGLRAVLAAEAALAADG